MKSFLWCTKTEGAWEFEWIESLTRAQILKFNFDCKMIWSVSLWIDPQFYLIDEMKWTFSRSFANINELVCHSFALWNVNTLAAWKYFWRKFLHLANLPYCSVSEIRSDLLFRMILNIFFTQKGTFWYKIHWLWFTIINYICNFEYLI